jgi:site-specific recombinase XerD
MMSAKTVSYIPQSPRLLDQLREVLRYKHYSLRTEEAYLYWVKFFVRWHGRNGQVRHPRELGAAEVEQFLSMLTAQRNVSVSTHNQALSALLFLYREVLGVQLPWLDDVQRPTRPRRIPSVLTVTEVATLLGVMTGVELLLAKLLYGSGMRLNEGLRLRVKDVDFDRHVLVVRDGKGGKDRVVMLPRSLDAALHSQMSQARTVWEHDRQQHQPGVEVPDALATNYPGLGQRWGADSQTGIRPHLAPFVCDPFIASRYRHPHRTRTLGPQRRQHHHDLHPRAQGGGGWHGQPAGCIGQLR